MSKGSNRRPMQIPPEEFDQRWEETFGVVARMAAEMAEGHWEYDEELELRLLTRRRNAFETVARYVTENRDPSCP